MHSVRKIYIPLNYKNSLTYIRLKPVYGSCCILFEIVCALAMADLTFHTMRSFITQTRRLTITSQIGKDFNDYMIKR